MSKLSIVQRLPGEKYDRASLAEILRQIEAQLNGLSEGRIVNRYSAMTAAPTTGNWARGDMVWNSEPSAGGFIGWVCTASGNPGTWRTWGAIS